MTYISWSSGFALYLEDFDVWTLYFVIMSQCSAAFALKQFRLGHSDLFFDGPLILPFILNSIWWVTVTFLLLFFALKNILVLLANLNSGELRCPATALIIFNFLYDPKSIDSVLPKCGDSLLSTNHLLHDSSSWPSLSEITCGSLCE